MSIETSLRAGGRVLLDRTSDVFPVYLLATGLLLTAQVPILLALGAIAFILVQTGAVSALLTEIEAIDPDAFDPETFDPESPEAAAEAFPPGFEEALLNVFTPTVVALFFLGVIGSVLVVLLARGFTNAATLSAVYAALRGEDGVDAAVDGIVARWKSFVALSLIEVTLLLLTGIPIAFSLALIALGSPAIGAVSFLLSLFIGLVVVLTVLLGFAFAGQSIVVDDVGVLTGIRGSFSFIVRNPIGFGGYILVAIGMLVLTGTLSGIFGALGVSQLSALLSPLVFLPFMDTFKTSLYAERAHTPIETPPTGDRLKTIFSDGIRTMGGFIRSHPGAHIGAAALFAGGALFGWSLTAGAEIPFGEPEDVGAVFGAFPVGTFISISVNNWLVGAGAAFGGVVVGIPTIMSLLFNGAIVGIAYGVTDPLVFYALVAPHGIIELPAIFIACAAGFHLAGVTIGALRGTQDRYAVATALRLVYRVLIGLAIVFVIAGFVEAFLTPPIAEIILRIF